MKLSEDILAKFDLEASTEKEPVNVMQVGEMIRFLEKCAGRIAQKSRLMCRWTVLIL